MERKYEEMKPSKQKEPFRFAAPYSDAMKQENRDFAALLASPSAAFCLRYVDKTLFK